MDLATRELVRKRAQHRCEYCGLHESQSPLAPLQIEHIIPRKHGRSDQETNLALACIGCNLHKGSNIAGYNPETGMVTELFHPRRDKWTNHFMLVDATVVGKTPIGRTTVVVLALNSDEQIELRKVIRES